MTSIAVERSSVPSRKNPSSRIRIPCPTFSAYFFLAKVSAPADPLFLAATEHTALQFGRGRVDALSGGLPSHAAKERAFEACPVSCSRRKDPECIGRRRARQVRAG